MYTPSSKIIASMLQFWITSVDPMNLSHNRPLLARQLLFIRKHDRKEAVAFRDHVDYIGSYPFTYTLKAD